MDIYHLRLENYEPKQSFYVMNKILKLLIALQMILVFFRIFVRNQEPFFLSDCLNACMMMLTYCQKNYCLALITMFYIFSLIYLNAIFFLQFVEYKLPFFIDYTKNFTLMLIFSTLLYVFESIMLYQVYKEFKGIIYDINQEYPESDQQDQLHHIAELLSQNQEQQVQQINQEQQQQAEQEIENQSIQEPNIAAGSLQRRVHNQGSRTQQELQELQS
ncbi:unnamed protein product (macronuclear) [Paramecium tetraurelia]|uniref:Transmembrane protein n=1 Tax=Paramecium tetraurelia TaxID=5888 RepID=A0DWS1_PARTE|nr:uncharacterized protein GSPATT00021131001 [Paramecium tetraurelia]CAK87488.1 unnamed protein product [Paramecium tetraurelia]|eukprot:XP_001454885.1 hypothetical protein (macronuclear) [Paramecium tetraurelia strain d4-2]